MKIARALIAAVALLAVPNAFAAEWQDQLQTQTRIKSGSDYADLEGSGYTLIDVAHTALLDASKSEVVTINLPTQGDYYLLGVCDNDCLDLDLAVSRNGTEIARDSTDDDWPLLELDNASGTYQVRVTMYQCSTPSCGYQLSVWKGSGGGSSGGGSWEAQLREQTRIKSGAGFADLEGNGYSLMDVARTNLLDASGSELVDINLPLGSEYVVMGVCDNDCSDLDLAVLKSGLELSADASTDDWPIVEIVPTGTTNYQIKVTMYACSTAFCGYQLTVWRR